MSDETSCANLRIQTGDAPVLPSADPEVLAAICIHESSHATVWLAASQSMSLDPDRDRITLLDGGLTYYTYDALPEPPIDALVISTYSGIIAESRFMGWPQLQPVGRDMRQIRELGQRKKPYPPRYLRTMRRRAGELVDQHWLFINWLGVKLFERLTIPGVELEAAFRDYEQDRVAFFALDASTRK